VLSLGDRLGHHLVVERICNGRTGDRDEVSRRAGPNVQRCREASRWCQRAEIAEVPPVVSPPARLIGALWRTEQMNVFRVSRSSPRRGDRRLHLSGGASGSPANQRTEYRRACDKASQRAGDQGEEEQHPRMLRIGELEGESEFPTPTGGGRGDFGPVPPPRKLAARGRAGIPKSSGGRRSFRRTPPAPLRDRLWRSFSPLLAFKHLYGCTGLREIRSEGLRSGKANSLGHRARHRLKSVGGEVVEVRTENLPHPGRIRAT
jgi:hypothetical protein